MSPPAKKSRESNTVVLSVKKGELYQETFTEKNSLVQRISGFPWRLRVRRQTDMFIISLICDNRHCHTFTSWEKGSQELMLASRKYGDMNNGGRVTIEITTNEDGESCRRIPTLDIIEPRDGILVIGDEKKKVYVNKQSLASQSTYFDRLFFGNFKENNMSEITIGDVEYEEFANLVRMIYVFDKTSLTDQNVRRVLELADMFDLKIVEDKVVNCLLYRADPTPINEMPILTLSTHQKLVISEQFNLPFLKDRLLTQYKTDQSLLKSLTESPEFEELSIDTVRYLLKMQCERIVD